MGIQDIISRARQEPALFIRQAVPWLSVIIPLWAILLFLRAAFHRVGYPYELEWMEGGCLDHVGRVMDFKALYTAPSVEFTPYIYTPFYYYVSAALAKVFGLSIPLLRMVSLLATLGSFVLLTDIVRRETGKPQWGIWAAGLYAATYFLTGYWFDLARVDALGLFMILLAAWRLYTARHHSGFIWAGIFAFLAFYTKQSYLPAGMALCAAAVWTDRLKGLRMGIAFGIAMLGTFGLMQLLSGGWYGWYVFSLPRQHEMLPDFYELFWTIDLWQNYKIPVILSLGLLLFLGYTAARSWRQGEKRHILLLLIVSLVGVSFLGRIHSGGIINVLMPVYAGLALGFGLAGGYLSRLLPGLAGLAVLLPLIMAGYLQWSRLKYDLYRAIPDEEDYAAGQMFTERLAGIPGDVWVVNHGGYSRLAGKSSYTSKMAVWDVERAIDRGPDSLLKNDIRDRLLAGDFAAVITNGPYLEWWLPDKYELVDTAIFRDHPGGLIPRSGAGQRPKMIWYRKDLIER